MDTKTKKSKELAEREQKAYHDLVRFIRWYASTNEVQGHWMLNKDDLTAELFLVLARLVPKYMDKPYDEFLLLARTSMNNAVSTLKYKALLTHRKLQFTAYPLDTVSEWEVSDRDSESRHHPAGVVSIIGGMSEHYDYETLNPAIYVDRAEQLNILLSKLSEFDKRVVDAVLGNNDRVRLYINMQRKRKEWVYANPTVITVNPLIIARALNEDLEEIKLAYKRIKVLFLS